MKSFTLLFLFCISVFVVVVAQTELFQDSREPPKTEVLIVGGGLPRTGTVSLKQALKKLGFNAFHMDEMFVKFQASSAIEAMQSERGARKWFTELTMLGFNATLDGPTCLLVKEQLDQYPNAKVILSIRRNEHEWFESFYNMMQCISFPLQSWPFSLVVPSTELFDKGFGGERGMKGANCINSVTYYQTPLLPWIRIREATLNEDHCKKWYLNHNQHVQDIVPKNKLLIFQSAEGWQPLCDFLGVPVPQEPYPRTNDANELIRIGKILKIVLYGWPFLILVPVVICAKLISTCSKRLLCGRAKG